MKECVFYEEFDPIYYFDGSSQNWHMQGYHFHKNYEIILFMSDGASIFIQDREYLVKKGDLFVLNNREYHKTSGEQHALYNRYVLMFDPDLISPMTQSLQCNFLWLFQNRPDHFIHKINLKEESRVQVVNLLQEIERIKCEEDSTTRCLLLLRIVELLILIQNLFHFFQVTPLKQTTYHKIDSLEFQIAKHGKINIESVKQYIKSNISTGFVLDDIASMFYINKFYLSHYFKRETGFCLSEYIKIQKILVAKTMLMEGQSVTQIALSLSYSSDSYFIRIFKEQTGMTPKKYQLAHRKM